MQSVIEIKRPVEAVYGFFLDLERSIVRTDPTVESVVKTTEGPLGAGTTFRLRQPVMGKVREQIMRVMSADPNRRIEMEAAFRPVRPRFSLAFEPTADGTRVTFQGDSRPAGPFRLVSFLMDRIGQRNWDRRLRLMKASLEAGIQLPTPEPAEHLAPQNPEVVAGTRASRSPRSVMATTSTPGNQPSWAP